MTSQQNPPLLSLPNSNVRDIKDGGRNIIEKLGYNQGTRDEVGITLKKLFGPKEAQQHIDGVSLKNILDTIEKRRAKIIELIAEKECVRVIVGAGKHVKEERRELAEKILIELEEKIQAVLGGE